MDNKTQQAANTTIQLLPGTTALTIVFVLLKAFDKIDWSWWLVFAPMWGPIALVFGVLGIMLGVYLVAMVLLTVVEPVERAYRRWRWGK